MSSKLLALTAAAAVFSAVALAQTTPSSEQRESRAPTCLREDAIKTLIDLAARKSTQGQLLVSLYDRDQLDHVQLTASEVRTVDANRFQAKCEADLYWGFDGIPPPKQMPVKPTDSDPRADGSGLIRMVVTMTDWEAPHPVRYTVQRIDADENRVYVRVWTGAEIGESPW